MNNKHMPLPLGAPAYSLKDSCCQLAVSVAQRPHMLLQGFPLAVYYIALFIELSQLTR